MEWIKDEFSRRAHEGSSENQVRGELTHASLMTSPSASYGLGTSLTPGDAVGCRRYTAEQVENEGSI